jgi:hypothetical protein
LIGPFRAYRSGLILVGESQAGLAGVFRASARRALQRRSSDRQPARGFPIGQALDTGKSVDR